MAISTLDQVIWTAATVTTDDTTAIYAYGDLLPEATTAGDLVNRAALLRGGAIRRVTVATTAEDFASAATTAATEAAAREAITDPILLNPGGAPIVADIA